MISSSVSEALPLIEQNCLELAVSCTLPYATKTMEVSLSHICLSMSPYGLVLLCGLLCAQLKVIIIEGDFAWQLHFLFWFTFACSLSWKGTVLRMKSMKVVERSKDYRCCRCDYTFTLHADIQTFHTIPKPSSCPSASGCGGTKFKPSSEGKPAFHLPRQTKVECDKTLPSGGDKFRRGSATVAWSSALCWERKWRARSIFLPIPK